MKNKQKTYRPASVSILTEGIRNMLFGELSARYLSRNYASVKSKLEKFREAEKESPGSYLSARSLIPGCDGRMAVSGEDTNGWKQAFYRYSVQRLDPFHPLCEFYHEFIYLECRMILTETELWRDSSTISNSELYYDILTLMELFAVFFRLSDERSGEEIYTGSGLYKKLRVYLARLLKYELGATLLELSTRFDDLLGPKAVTPEKLYVYILNQASPDPIPFYKTRHFVRYALPRSNLRTDPVARLSDFINMYMSNRPAVDEAHMKEQVAIRRLIENTCCASIFLHAADASDSEISELWEEPDKSGKVVSYCMKQIEEGKGGEFNNVLFYRLSRLAKVMDRMEEGKPNSEAGLLLQSLKHSGILFRQQKKKGDGFAANNEKQSPAGREGGHPVLQDLVSIDELRERLQISMVTLNKYLEESGIPVIKFSAKSRWLYSRDCRKFLDYFITNNGRDGED